MGDEDSLKFCTNCKRDVPQANFIMHSMHCQRNLALCTKCDEPIPVVDLMSHNATFHAMIECPACNQKIEKMKLVDHEQTACKHRAICCTYCHIETEASELQEHENYCGSRTEKCEECGEFVMLKYTQLHLDSNHGFLKLDEEPGPTASWNKPRSSPGLLNDLTGNLIRKVPNASQNPIRSYKHTRTSDVDFAHSTPSLAKGSLGQRNDNFGLPTSYAPANYGYSPRSFQDPVRTFSTWNTPDSIGENSSRNPPDLVRGNPSRNAQEPVRGSTSWNPSQESTRPLSARNSTAQESVRPSAAGNRLSPSKRTNDMPQINSTAAVAISKALHKPVIKQSDNERLMAGLSKLPEHSPYALANSMMENLDLDLGGGEMVALPCEFCEAMIPANQLVIHETGCRPDLACFKSQTHPDVLGDNGLPCEFCGGLYPPHNLLSHQAHCELPIRGDKLVNELDFPVAKEVNAVKKKQSNLPEEDRVRLPQPLRHSPLFNARDNTWQKPTANVNPIGGFRQPAIPSTTSSGIQNGHQQRPMSTGAVPKQKAGTRTGLHEVQQEVSRPSTSPVNPRNFESHR